MRTSKTVLITGGARSGKSKFAQELAQKQRQPVLFVATAEPGDEEMRQRIARHQQERPATWRTLEVSSGVGSQILKSIDRTPTVIIDCITLLVNNVLGQHGDFADAEIDDALIEQEVMSEINGLVDCIDQTRADFIIVTNEVGLGLVPADKISRLYRDLLGKANQLLAKRADEVYLMVSGIPIPVKTT